MKRFRELACITILAGLLGNQPFMALAEDVAVPSDKFMAYEIPAGGAELVLNIRPSDSNKSIKSSSWTDQDNDTKLWNGPSHSNPCALNPALYGLHKYQAMGVQQGHQWLLVQGTLTGCAAGGGTQGPATTDSFDVRVPAVTDVNVSDPKTVKMTLPGKQNFVTVKGTGDVVLTATIKQDSSEVLNSITWETTAAGVTLTCPGVGTDKRTVKFSRATTGGVKVPLSIKIAGKKQWEGTVWIVWGTVTIQSTGTTPANAVQFGTRYDGTENLGGKTFTGGTFGVGKVVPVAQLTPAGVHTVVTSGWGFKREMYYHDFADGVLSPDSTTAWKADLLPDGTDGAYQMLTPDSNDKIYDRDAPGVGAYDGATKCFETYNKFHQWITWNNVVASDGTPGTDTFPAAAEWHWKAKWQSTATPHVILMDVGGGYISIPNTSSGCP